MLIVATIGIVGAVVLVADGLRRVVTPTAVKAEAVAVSPDEALGPLIRPDASEKSIENATVEGPSLDAKAKHAAFMKGSFESYYQTYRRLAVSYNKPEDRILTKAELATRLGYAAEAIDANDTETASPSEDASSATSEASIAAAYAAIAATGESEPNQSPAEAISLALARTSKLFQTDPTFAETQINVINRAIADGRLTGKSQKYKAAQKTAQSCSTVYQTRAVWDSNSTACTDWYYRPYGCSVRRAVPVEQCVPAYPKGIESPLETFARLDESYRLAWADKTAQAEAVAAEKSEKKLATKAAAPAMFLLALKVFGGFLVVMFMFLLIAIERHMRHVASQGMASPSKI